MSAAPVTCVPPVRELRVVRLLAAEVFPVMECVCVFLPPFAMLFSPRGYLPSSADSRVHPDGRVVVSNIMIAPAGMLAGSPALLLWITRY